MNMPDVQVIYLCGAAPTKGANAGAIIRARDRMESAGLTVLVGDGKVNRQAALSFLLCADALAILPGWWDSQSAMLDMAIAKNLELPIFNAMTMKPFEEPVFIDFCHNSFRWSGEVV